MKNVLKSPAFYGIIIMLGLSSGVSVSYPLPVLVILVVIVTVIAVNFVQNQSNRRTVAQMEVLGGIMNKAKSPRPTAIEKYMESMLTQRISELDEGNTLPQQNTIEFTNYESIPVLPNSID